MPHDPKEQQQRQHQKPRRKKERRIRRADPGTRLHEVAEYLGKRDGPEQHRDVHHSRYPALQLALPILGHLFRHHRHQHRMHEPLGPVNDQQHQHRRQ
jgi:hypothetical protein